VARPVPSGASIDVRNFEKFGAGFIFYVWQQGLVLTAPVRGSASIDMISDWVTDIVTEFGTYQSLKTVTAIRLSPVVHFCPLVSAITFHNFHRFWKKGSTATIVNDAHFGIRAAIRLLTSSMLISIVEPQLCNAT